MLDTEKYPVEIRYTLDGKIPGATSLRYDKPFIINDSVVVKAAIFREGKNLDRYWNVMWEQRRKSGIILSM